ncbi:hypothetical protein ACI7YT_12325 [Microbacterium sp. M]|uniref:hypothetical protein n=1 Tax=Microbacterium sp. M TaxID=3377125 RepID=UPI0038665D2E
MTLESGWFVEPLPRRGYARRPHFYAAGQERSVCQVGHRGADGTVFGRRLLGFDPATARTTEPDPRLGEAQFRRECGSCVRELREGNLSI